jgi:hypothetical protein
MESSHITPIDWVETNIIVRPVTSAPANINLFIRLKFSLGITIDYNINKYYNIIFFFYELNQDHLKVRFSAMHG